MGDVLLSSKLYVQRKPRTICVVGRCSLQQPHCPDGSVCHSGHPAAPPSASPPFLTHFPSGIQNAVSSRISRQEGQLGRNISAGGGKTSPCYPGSVCREFVPASRHGRAGGRAHRAARFSRRAGGPRGCPTGRSIPLTKPRSLGEAVTSGAALSRSRSEPLTPSPCAVTAPQRSATHP